jgi:hypothetical protein
MNYLILILVSIFGSTMAWASSEIDSEINDLQVRIVRLQPKPKVRPKPQVGDQTSVSPKIYTYNAAAPRVQQRMARPLYATTPLVAATAVRVSNTQSPPPRFVSQQVATQNFQPTDNYSPAPQLVSKPAPEQINYETKFIRRFELVPAFTISSFDGSDSSTLVPNGVSSPFTSSFLNAALRTDVDLGFAPFYLEIGLMMNQLGSTTGTAASNLNLNVQGVAYQEKVTLTYLTVPVDIKWRLAPEESSALFVKAGLMPAFMVGHNYQNSTPVSSEYRFGAYNTFDLMVDGGLGYDFKITKSIHALAEVSVFQGLMPVMTNFSVYNSGFITGRGVAYLL